MAKTKLSTYCSGIIEAAWLIALIIIPLFFNTFSSRIFEPEKIALLRTLTLVGAGAWLIKITEELFSEQKPRASFRNIWQSVWKTPLIPFVLILTLAQIIATIFSVTPATSFWGSYQRLQGTYTFLAYVLLFGMVVGNLRTSDQVNRILTVVILTSLPAAIYGIIQHNGLDPIPWAGNVTTRVTSSLGNPIFIAAYLTMVFPLTVVKILHVLRQNEGNFRHWIAKGLLVLLYSTIAILQIVTIIFSGSRGPWLGLGVSLVILWFGFAYLKQWKWMVFSGFAAILIGSVFLITLNIPAGPLAPLRSNPTLGRLGQLLDAESRTGKVRSLIWQGSSQLVLPHAPLEYPDGKMDQWNVLRPLIGYGPESMFVAYNRFYPTGLAQVEKRNAAPDRSHNETWDILVFSGIVGLGATLAFYGAVVYFGLAWLGMLRSRKEKKILTWITLGGGVISGLFFTLWKGFSFVGVGLPFGLLVGVIIFILFTPLFNQFPDRLKDEEIWRLPIIVGIMAILLGHFTEIVFGFGFSVTKTYFWVFTGVLIVAGHFLPTLPAQEDEKKVESIPSVGRKAKSASKKRVNPAPRGQTSKGGIPQWLKYSFMAGGLVTVMMVTLFYDFILSQTGWNGWEILGKSLVKSGNPGESANFSVLILLLICWLSAITIFTLEGFETVDSRQRLGMGAGIVLISLILALIFLLWHTANLSSITQNMPKSVDEVMNQVRAAENIPARYYGYLMLLVFFLGWSLVRQWPETRNTVYGLVAVPILVGLLIPVTLFTNLRKIQADISFKTADTFARPDYWPGAISIYNRAIDLAPDEDYYYLFLARAYLEYSKSLTDAQSSVSLMVRAEKDMLHAQAINPLNVDHTANLARLYSFWAGNSKDPTEKGSWLQKSADYYREALKLSPNNSRIWGEYALLILNQFGQPEKAYEILTHALALDPTYDWLNGLLGDYYLSISAKYPEDSSDHRENLAKSLLAYQQASKLSSGSDISFRYRLMISKAGIHSRLGEYTLAIRAYEEAAQLNPSSPDLWRVEQIIASLYMKTGDLVAARDHAQKAYETAPAENQAKLMDFLNEINRKLP